MKRAITPSEHFQKVQFLCPACFCEGSLHFLLENNVDEILVVVPHLVLDPVALDPVHQQSFVFPGKGNKMKRMVYKLYFTNQSKQDMKVESTCPPPRLSHSSAPRLFLAPHRRRGNLILNDDSSRGSRSSSSGAVSVDFCKGDKTWMISCRVLYLFYSHSFPPGQGILKKLKFE